MENTAEKKLIERPPVIVIMGHIDHGKSTLLDYIRKTNITKDEAGGITQHISAYVVKHKNKSITFLDTPGHEAFSSIRVRGAHVADIAVLVVSAEDGVKPQTLEALKRIKEEDMPYIVAINKIDKPGANIERTKQGLVENEIYLEGYGGNVPVVPISAKEGTGVTELLDMMLLIAEMEELKGDLNKNAEGILIESNLDAKKGISGSLIITDGTIKKGMYVVAEDSMAPVRIMENFLGESIDTASFSSPVNIIGWNKLPSVGSPFTSFNTKKEAEEYCKNHKKKEAPKEKKTEGAGGEKIIVPIIIKADTHGSLEALFHEIAKIKNDRVSLNVIHSGIGDIAENDVKLASGNGNPVILGFNVKADTAGISIAERLLIPIKTFNIIYKLTEWLESTLAERTPQISVEEVSGEAKVLKVFSRVKDKQVIGGRAESGEITLGSAVKIIRRDAEIAEGRIRELQQQKKRVSEVKEKNEFGAMVECKMDIAPGDKIRAIKIVKK